MNGLMRKIQLRNQFWKAFAAYILLAVAMFAWCHSEQERLNEAADLYKRDLACYLISSDPSIYKERKELDKLNREWQKSEIDKRLERLRFYYLSIPVAPLLLVICYVLLISKSESYRRIGQALSIIFLITGLIVGAISLIP